MSDLHDEFEAWYEENEDNRRSLRSLRTSESYLPTNFYLCGCFEGWKASRAEFSALAASHQRLKEALGELIACRELHFAWLTTRSDPYYITEAGHMEAEFDRREPAAWDAASEALRSAP